MLLIVVVSINIAWRSFGFWLPKFLQQEKEYGEKTTAMLTSGFFAFADLGSIAVGAGTLWLFRRGIRLVRARQICFGVCAAMAAMSVVAAIAPKGVLLIAILFVVGFGALGLFPTYFAMSQEISQRHQAKVTGTLGCLNAVFLAVMFPVQGYLIDRFGSFSLALGVAGLFPVVGLVALFFWGSDSKTAK